MHDTQPVKAIIAFVLTFASALLASLQGRQTLDGMGAVDWIIIVLGAIVTAGAVYGATNPPTRRG
jgi:uncharacterized membrane protein YcaP (DUF421 family)